MRVVTGRQHSQARIVDQHRAVPDQGIGALALGRQGHNPPVPDRHSLIALGVCLAGLCHGMDAACLDDDVSALVVIVSFPGAGLLLTGGRSGVRLLWCVGSHRGPPIM